MQYPEDEYGTEKNREALDRVLSPLEPLRIPRGELKIHDKYMTGGFGVVRQATWLRDQASPSPPVADIHRPDESVAVKELICPSPQSLPLRLALRFARELSVWRNLNHPNILPCLGFNLDIEQGDAYFVSPYIPGGSIRARLNAAPFPSADQRMQWITDLTIGLNYLHTFKFGDKDTPIVHGDLKTANILINQENRAMLCDFGLSSIIQEAENTGLTTSDDFKGSIRWCSPELMENNSRTTYSDVWSWALCVLEILTSRVPYHRQKTVIAVSIRIVQGPPLDRNEYPELPQTSAMWAILEDCLKQKPTSRATIQECWRRLVSLGDQDNAILLNDLGDMRHPRPHYSQEIVVDDPTVTIMDQGAILNRQLSQSDRSDIPNAPSKSPILVHRPNIDLQDLTTTATPLNILDSFEDRTLVGPRGRPARWYLPGNPPATWILHLLPPYTFRQNRRDQDIPPNPRARRGRPHPDPLNRMQGDTRPNQTVDLDSQEAAKSFPLLTHQTTEPPSTQDYRANGVLPSVQPDVQPEGLDTSTYKARRRGSAWNDTRHDRIPQHSEEGLSVDESGKARLIVGMDLGMAFSGVSYAYLRPSMKSKVRDVVFKGQENEPGNTNVPTVLFHDEARDTWYCGAETAGLSEEEKSELVKFEWFKLQFPQSDIDDPNRSLPRMSGGQKPAPAELFRRFFEYLYSSLKVDFEATESNKHNLWQQMAPEAEYVITHPNDWSCWHQDQLRSVLIDAGIVSKGDGERVTFLSEGEANLHWWLEEDTQTLEFGKQVVICDAGGGTIDVSSYAVTCVEPLQLREVKSSDIKAAGAASVTQAFRDHITGKLQESHYGRPDKINRMVEVFESSAKRLFANAQAAQRIEFGFTDDNDEKYDIKSGTLSISSEIMEHLFEPSCLAAIEAIRNHASPNSYVVLVGGLSGNPWFYHRISTALTDITNLKRASSRPGKIVARGAVDFLLKNRAISRVARRTIGLAVDIPYDERLPSHLHWQTQVKIDPVSGRQLLPGRFCPLVVKGDILSDDSVMRIECIQYDASDDSSHDIVFELTEYAGQVSGVEFTLDDASCFLPLGDFKVKIPRSAFQRIESSSPCRTVYWEARYTIAFNLGQTEIKCYVEWIEEGATKRLLAVPHWKKH